MAAIIAHMKPPLPTEVVEAAPPDVGNAAAVIGLPGPGLQKVNEVDKPEEAPQEGGECAPAERRRQIAAEGHAQGRW